ncbi:hypothetical protein [Chamaesiphon polymorphus]|uniref:Uncharacterized protein n=1 Tax=Chamaesiphon polymorphus CCALA 037 TaxID=2107692 RepID=A0A2T1GAT2_9CYAN|nr:hypothetical protein [Chamaesiphon polymorphus]PSB54371.1 hypothetical protein C7B77_18345 [Chamaesiphon polymorphus CCALA 037]
MPKTIMIPKAAVDETIAMFGELPAKQPSDYPLKEAIERILPAINGLVKKGYNLDEICTLLAQKEIIVTSSRLKQYLRDFNKSHPKQSRKPRLPVVTTVPALSPANNENESQPEATVKPQATPKPEVTKPATNPDKPYKSPPKPGAEQFK